MRDDECQHGIESTIMKKKILCEDPSDLAFKLVNFRKEMGLASRRRQVRNTKKGDGHERIPLENNRVSYYAGRKCDCKERER